MPRKALEGLWKTAASTAKWPLNLKQGSNAQLHTFPIRHCSPEDHVVIVQSLATTSGLEFQKNSACLTDS